MALTQGATQGREGWQYEVAEPSSRSNETGDAVQCFTVGQLAQQAGVSGFEYVKMDIEGAEREVLSEGEGYDPVDWMQHVQLLSIETHEKRKPHCKRALKRALQRSGGWEMVGKSGEYLVFERRNLSSM